MRINRHISLPPTDGADRRPRGTTAPPGSDKAGASVVSINQHSGVEAAEIQSELKLRLEEVRQQIKGGTYKVDLDRLAENIINDEFGPDPSGDKDA